MPDSLHHRRIKLAVLGGGMASLSAVYELTRDPKDRARFDITVYQLGFRLGGKGASGRAQGDDRRIEEHGLHVLFGAYANSLALMREVYAEWSRFAPSRPRSFDDMLLGLPSVTFLEPEHAPASRWRIEFPPNDLPPVQDSRDLAGATLRANLLRMLRTTLGRTMRAVRRSRASAALLSSAGLGFFVWARSLSSLLRWVQSRPLADAEQLHKLLATLRPLAEQSWRFVERRTSGIPELRRLAVQLDLTLAIATGMLSHGLTSAAFDAADLDDEDFRTWIRRHGAREASIESALVRGLYDAAFTKAGQYGAGTLLQVILWMFSYRGHVAYLMREDMGTTIFAPLYEVLRQRGVRFEFFQRVERLVADDGRDVTRIGMSRQAEALDAEYDPLVWHDGVPSWPTTALFDRLRGGAALRTAGVDFENHWQRSPLETRRELHVGKDFDHVLLGISLGALPELCADLADKDPRFRSMIEHVPTRPTLGLQLWTSASAEQLGWKRDRLVVGQPAPIDTCADMSHLLASERFRGSDAPRGLFYLCTGMIEREPMPDANDHGYPGRLLSHAREHVSAHLEGHAQTLWPEWRGPASMPRDERVYLNVPKNPSDRYVPASVGATRYRLRADESGFSNLTLAGDWTRTIVNAGAVEAACASGRLAARTLGANVGVLFGESPELREVWRRPPEERRRLNERTRGRRYVVRDGDFAPASRYVSRDSRMYTFWLRADPRALRRVCDRYLNLGGPYEYRPVGGLLSLVAADCKAMAPLEGRDRGTGTARERDVGFWIPVMKGRSHAGRFEPESFAFFIPYIWVDNYLGLLGGREVFGFPKLMGELSMPGEPGDLARFEARSLAIARFSPAAEARTEPIVIAQRVDRLRWDEPGSTATSAGNLLHSLAGLLQSSLSESFDPALLANAVAQAQAGVVPMVFLKQVPDPSDCDVAAYQAIVEAESRVLGSLHGGGLLPGKYEVSVYDYDSSRIARELGLGGVPSDSGSARPADAAILTPVAQHWIHMDFTIERARVVWRGS